MAKVVTVTLNPAVDMVVAMPSLVPEAVNKARSAASHCGGKGLNVSLVLSLLGTETTACGFLGRDNSEPFAAFCKERDIGFAFLLLPGATRTNVKLAVDGKGATDVNLPGLRPSAADIAALKDAIPNLAQKGDWVVLSGSLPPGVDDGIYAELIGSIRAHGCFACLDASGPALAKGLAAGPDLAKPNHEELLEISPPGAGDVVVLAREWVEKGVGRMAVSMGGAGAALATKTGVFSAPRADVEAVNLVGAGDSFLAAMLHGRLNGMDDRECLAFATALSAHWVEKMERTRLDPARVRALAEAIYGAETGQRFFCPGL